MNEPVLLFETMVFGEITMLALFDMGRGGNTASGFH